MPAKAGIQNHFKSLNSRSPTGVEDRRCGNDDKDFISSFYETVKKRDRKIPKMNILLVEDEVSIAETITENIVNKKYKEIKNWRKESIH